MATSTSGLSSAGIGSGLDVNTIVSKMMAVEELPLTQMQDQATKLNSKLSAYGKLQSYVSALGDAASKLALSSTWDQTTVTSGNDSSVSATTTANATPGSYSVQVTALASAQALASSTVSDPTAAVGSSGSLRIEAGTWNSDQSSFSPINYPSFVDVAISSSDSLEGIRDKINASSAGVSASIVTDSSGSRLILRSKATGAESGFRVTVADDDGNNTDASGLSKFGYDPSSGVTSMTQTKAAGDASAMVDGLVVTSSTNQFTGVLQGLTFTAKAITTTPVDITVTSDSKTLRANMDAFVSAYNDLASNLTTLTKYDDTTKTGGALQGDTSTNALRSALRMLGTSTSGTSTLMNRLSQIGLDPQSDGTLKVDGTKLDAAVAQPDEMRKMFSDTTPGVSTDDGFGKRISDWSNALLSIDGAVATRQKSLQTQISSNTKQQADFNDRMTSVEARLRAQYSALDTQMSQMTALQTYVTQQITSWNKSG